MFYFDKINGKRILKSDRLTFAEHFFTTRETIIKSKEPEMQGLVEINKQDHGAYCANTNIRLDNDRIFNHINELFS